MRKGGIEMCFVPWCNNKPSRSGHGYCRRHYDEIRKYGHITDKRLVTDKNDFVVCSGYAEIILRNKDMVEVARAIVDVEDLEYLLSYKWSLKDNGYARTTVNGKTVHMHQMVLRQNGSIQDMEIDHINRIKLDNRKSNLRYVPHYLNMHNRNYKSGCVFKITNRPLTKPFYASICINNKPKNLGYFHTEKEAVDAIENYKQQQGIAKF